MTEKEVLALQALNKAVEGDGIAAPLGCVSWVSISLSPEAEAEGLSAAGEAGDVVAPLGCVSWVSISLAQ
jgi:hypothetical protein